ncbi:lysozyme [Devosia crocina]|uniref:Lysozyme n=1 Tax=Devosia crocina TaxID=429728 RepID=A0A1I7N9R0_9HYPH|nr:lysozyme [Devosia crocina]SFV31410.1 lysozyme [Devosia crocina]
MSKTWKRGAMALALVVSFVGGWEGMRTTAYRDIVGVPTICFGETRGVKMGDTATVEECKTMLGDGIVEFAAAVDKCLTVEDRLPHKTYAAFVSLSYNIGTGAFCRSTLVRKANLGDFLGACDQLLVWNRAGGKVVQGLVNRRKAEHAMCLEGLAGK